MNKAKSVVGAFFKKPETGGLVLMLAMGAALVCANTPLAQGYNALWEQNVGVSFGFFQYSLSLRHVVDELLMTLFFLMIGCELKRGFLEGELSTWKQRRLPLVAALGGMLVPALIFVFLNLPMDSLTMKGWAIPTATDIAFALGVFAFLGQRVPAGLKTFLLALAIIDDMGAIILISLFYSSGLQAVGFISALGAMILLWALNKRGVTNVVPYVLLGGLLWLAFLKAGVHATLSGVALAAFIPLRLRRKTEGQSPPLHHVEKALYPWVTFLIMPLFAFANAGVSLGEAGRGVWTSPLTLGVLAGLFFGKQIGVMAAAWLAVHGRFCSLPSGARWLDLYGLSVLCGIGFTMSLFIGGLAFDDPESLTAMRIGVLSASTLSAIVGYAALSWASSRRRKA